MAKDNLQTYLAAKADFDDAAHRIVELGQLLFRVGQAMMASPPKLIVKDDSVEALTFGGVTVVDPAAWPAPEELGGVLSRYHVTRVRADELFRALPSEVQEIAPPPGVSHPRVRA
jgi:hypothetical protein